jgi:hypothetical protein
LMKTTPRAFFFASVIRMLLFGSYRPKAGPGFQRGAVTTKWDHAYS